MRELKPYRTMQGLRKAIDNGGRFYNLFTDADDHIVTRAELAKAAGVFSAGVNAFLFLEMAQLDLQPDDRRSIIALLESDLRENYRRGRPKTLLPSEIEKHGTAGRPVIATGFPRFVEDRTQFSGFIMIPIVAGRVTTSCRRPSQGRTYVTSCSYPRTQVSVGLPRTGLVRRGLVAVREPSRPSNSVCASGGHQTLRTRQTCQRLESS